MQVLTMGAESIWHPLRKRAFAARLSRLKELEGAIVQAKRALSVTTSAARVFNMPSLSKADDDPAFARRTQHWPILFFRLGGRIPVVLLRQDGVLTRIVASTDMPLGWTVPIDLRELSLWRINRVIRKLKKIGARS